MAAEAFPSYDVTATFYTVFCSIITKTKITISMTTLVMVKGALSRRKERRRRGRRGDIRKKSKRHQNYIYIYYYFNYFIIILKLTCKLITQIHTQIHTRNIQKLITEYNEKVRHLARTILSLISHYSTHF
jgi:hypothetical protein